MIAKKVVDAAGGRREIHRRLGLKSGETVSMWIARDSIPKWYARPLLAIIHDAGTMTPDIAKYLAERAVGKKAV